MHYLIALVLLLSSLATANAQTPPTESEGLPTTTRTPGNLYDFGDSELAVERVYDSVAVIKVVGTDNKFLINPTTRLKAGKPYRFDVRYFEVTSD